MRFYLGAPEPNWLDESRVSLCVSHIRLARRAEGRAAKEPWILDSGGFSELQIYGRWRSTPQQYIRFVRIYREFGNLAWAAPQDWMCEPAVINGGVWNGVKFAGTHLTVLEHQRRTVRNYLELRDCAPELPFVPVLQGYTLEDYLRCRDMYERAGVNLERELTVGLGSVCRRQATEEAAAIVRSLQPLRLHGFGMKTSGLLQYGHMLASSDSMAWSYDARRTRPLPGCVHEKCANCLAYALRWRYHMLMKIGKRTVLE